MTYDFDRVWDRKDTYSVKWDGVGKFSGMPTCPCGWPIWTSKRRRP